MSFLKRLGIIMLSLGHSLHDLEFLLKLDG